MVEAELRVGGSSTFDYRRLLGERISLPGEATTSVSGIVGRQPQGNLFRGRGRSQRELAGVVLPPGLPACGFEVAWAVPWLDGGPHRLADRPHGCVYIVSRTRLIVFINLQISVQLQAAQTQLTAHRITFPRDVKDL